MSVLCEFSTRRLADTARAIRRRVIDVACASRCPHVGCALSCVDILTALYFDVLRLEPWEQRDIAILSKGHASLALCCTLAEREILSEEMLAGYFRDKGTLPAHLDRFSARGIEVSTGALGHGFNIGLGMAFGFKQQNSDRKVFCIIGDGESQEGSIWEGAMFGAKLRLGNFTAILDYNNLQGYGRPKDTCCFEPIADKWEAFGWQVVEVDGHDIMALTEALAMRPDNKPRMVIAHTIKGKGISFMEDRLQWHYYLVTEELKQKALQELA
ncbi:MAG: transketolase [Sedimentisphaerales bacterium]|nr:transketolase [Sedimentisphaerales bacterium]